MSMGATRTGSLNQQKDTKLLRGALSTARFAETSENYRKSTDAHFLFSPNSIPIDNLRVNFKREKWILLIVIQNKYTAPPVRFVDT